MNDSSFDPERIRPPEEKRPPAEAPITVTPAPPVPPKKRKWVEEVTQPAEEALPPRLKRLAAMAQIASPLLAVAVIFLLGSLFVNITARIVSAYFPSLRQSGWYPYLVGSLPMYALAMPVSLIFFKMVKPFPPEKKRMSVPVFLGLICVSFFLAEQGNSIGQLLNLILGHTGETALSQSTSEAPFLANLLFVGILGPILEELFLRKFVVDRFLRLGEIPAVLLSGIAFGLIHATVDQLFYTMFIGILLSYVYVRTGNILYTIGLHMSFNILSGVLASELLKLLGGVSFNLLNLTELAEQLSQNPLGTVLYLAYFLFTYLLTLGAPPTIALLIVFKRRQIKKGSLRLSAADWAVALALNPAVWGFLGVVAYRFIRLW